MAQIYYVIYYGMWTFLSKNVFGLLIIHPNRFDMHFEPETLLLGGLI